MTAHFWDAQADRFDEAPDHGLRDAEVRAAWRDLLLPVLPTPPSTIADLGCGTGSISVLLAAEGHTVTGIDLSAAMVAAATAKALSASFAPPAASATSAASGVAGVRPTFHQGDAATPPLEPGTFDVVFARHVLWALPDPLAVLGRWIGLLRPQGRLVLVEGHWSTGAGLTAAHTTDLIAAHGRQAHLHPLTDPVYWGGPITDERYLIVSP